MATRVCVYRKCSLKIVQKCPVFGVHYNGPQKLDHMRSENRGIMNSMCLPAAGREVSFMPKGKRHSAQFKFKVALDAAKGTKTLSELACLQQAGQRVRAASEPDQRMERPASQGRCQCFQYDDCPARERTESSPG